MQAINGVSGHLSVWQDGNRWKKEEVHCKFAAAQWMTRGEDEDRPLFAVSPSLLLSIQPEDDDDDDVPSVIIITLSSACRCDMCLSHFQYEIFFATCFISPLLKGMLCSQGTRRGVCCARWLGETQVSCVMNGRERGTCSMNYALVLNDNLLASLYYYAAAHRRCVTVGCHRIGGDRWWW